MILTAHQPVYLPWLGLFHKIALADKFCYFDNVQYQPKDWNNRNKIKFSNGKADWLSVPVLRKGFMDLKFIDLEINNTVPWQRKHWRAIEHGYHKALFYEDYALRIKKFYEMKWNKLIDLNYEMLLAFMEILGINTPVITMRDFNFIGQKSDLVLNMCLTLQADAYIFGTLGREYADIEAFKAQGVIPFFQDYKHPEYPQLYGDFISHLSIVDLIFNCGPNSLSVLMAHNQSKDEILQLCKQKDFQ